MKPPHELIDAWIQHPTPGFVNHPMFESLRRWMGMGDEAPEIPLEFTIAAMDQAGVKQAMTCAWCGPQGFLISNEDVAGWVGKYPGRLVGVAAVNALRPVEAVRELRRCVRDGGFKALRILPWLWNLPSNDRHFYPLYAECVELGIPVCLQVGHTGPMCPSDPGRPIPYVDEIALDSPDLVIVGGHIGYPWTNEMISLATKYPNVYIDTSAYKAKRYPPELVAFMKARGRKKVLFGSNYPMLMPQAALEGFDALGLDEEARRLFLRENAQKVFRLE
jgi:predicted TIM-barrel fold metal-dependent hydrolase